MARVEPRPCGICGLHCTPPNVSVDGGATHYHISCTALAEEWVALKSRILGVSADEYLTGRNRIVHREPAAPVRLEAGARS